MTSYIPIYIYIYVYTLMHNKFPLTSFEDKEQTILQQKCVPIKINTIAVDSYLHFAAISVRILLLQEMLLNIPRVYKQLIRL